MTVFLQKQAAFCILLSLMLFLQERSLAQVIAGSEANQRLNGAEYMMLDSSGNIRYARMSGYTQIPSSDIVTFLQKVYNLRLPMALELYSTEQDEIGFTHLRYRQTCNNIPVNGGILIAHVRNNILYAFNGEIFNVQAAASNMLPEKQCLEQALKTVAASQYKWEIPEEESAIREIKADASATWYPKGILVYCPAGMNYRHGNFVLTYRFAIYANKPLIAENIYVNAVTGDIVARENLLHSTDVPGKATTKYSGTQNITTDSTAPGAYRLRESARGNGIYTLNMKTGTNYGAAVDFTDADNTWNNVNAQKDEVATDAHWGAEQTYDYYKNKFNRFSYDNNNARIYSYVHYASGYDNAFWNGVCMTYGDGTSFKPLTAIDVCGHEITHAVTSYTANLNYSYESGALNESFSDIFGNAIERYSRPAAYSWKIGEDITYSGNGLRNMATPTILGQPRCYKGTNWYYGSGDNGGVHTNSGVQNWWFYLISEGGKGTNDFGNAYKVDSLGILSAEKIAYRNLTVYLTASSVYTDARFYSIIAATDLFGNCSKEVIAVTNAWYACGVGAKYDSGYVKANFTADTIVCKTNKTVNFYNLSTNSKQCKWYFGTGDTSNLFNPTYVYPAYGNYTVKLVAKSCFKFIKDSMTRVAYIKVDSTYDICNAVLMKAGSKDSTSRCESFVYDDGGEGFYKTQKTSYFIINVPGADSIRLRFLDLDYEKNYDSLYLYRGRFPGPGSLKIGGFTGNTVPFSGNFITISGGTITLKQFADQYVVGRGFKMYYKAFRKPVSVTAFTDTTICYGNSTLLYARGKGGYSPDYLFHWKNITTNDSIIVSPVTDTKYKVYLTDVCTKSKDSSEITVSVSKPLNVQLRQDTIICNGNALKLIAAGSGGNRKGYQYTWNQGLTADSAHTVKPLMTTTYQVILSDGCTINNDTAQVTVYVKPALSVKVKSSDTLICYNNNISLSAEGSGGDTLQHSYTWSHGLGTGNSKNTSLNSTRWYRVTLTDACSVTPASDSVKITVRPPLTVTLSNDTTICLGTSTGIAANAAGGKSSAYIYQWTEGLPGTASQTVSPAIKTTYVLTLKDNCSADAKDSVTIDVLPGLSLSGLKDTTICYGGTAQLKPLADGGKPAQYQFEWNNGLGSTSNQSVSPFSTTAYRLILKDNCSVKSDTLSVNVTVTDKLSLIADIAPAAICKGDSAKLTLQMSGGIPAQYEWYINGVRQYQTSMYLKPGSSSNYTIDLKDNCSNDESKNTTLTVNPLPVVDFDAAQTAVCRNAPLQFNNLSTGASSYTWFFSTSDSSKLSDPVYTYSKAGTYTVTLKAISAQGCKSELTKNNYITVVELPVSNFSYNPLKPDYLNPDVIFSNNSTNYSGFEWRFGDMQNETSVASPTHTYGDTGAYTVMLITRNSLGCTDTMLQNLYIKDVYTLYVPNAVSPDNDQINDVLFPEGRGIRAYHMSVYNRWGQRIFESNDLKKGFDGTDKNGNTVPKDVYLLMLEVTDFEGRTHSFKQMIHVF